MQIQSIPSLRLKAMTLRGVGSYLHGERLDIRPLTVLCGNNGAGKSTWIAVLNLLRENCANGSLPLLRKTSDAARYINSYLLSLIAPCGSDLDKHLLETFQKETVNESKAYGPLRTVGLHVMTTSDLELAPQRHPYSEQLEDPNIVQEVLLRGHIRKGTELRLRFTVPGDLCLVPADASFELAVREKGADDYTIATTLKDLVDFADFPRLPNMSGQFPDEEFALCVNESLFGSAHNTSTADVARVVVSPSGDYKIKPSADARERVHAEITELVLSRIEEIVGLVFDSVFHIGAVRGASMVPDDEVTEGNCEDRQPQPRDRSVGSTGENLLLRYREFALNRMIQARPPYTGYIKQDFRDPCEDSTQVSPNWHCKVIDIFRTAVNGYLRPDLRRIWESTDDLTRQKIYRLADREADEGAAKDVVLKLLNDTLIRSDLYAPGLWGEVTEEAEFLIGIGVEKLNEWDRRRLNRLLIQNALEIDEMYDDYTCYTLCKYFAVWMNSLLETHPDPYGHGGGAPLTSLWQCGEGNPTGYLVNDNTCCSFGKGREIPYDQSARLFYSPCFPAGLDSGDVSNLSSGFCQVAPIVLQLGLMLPNELLCVENPEVHLHPKLQTKITEFLISEAWTGKTIIVETHSDLVVYRMLRAILQEMIAQSAVAIYFVSLVGEQARQPAYSRLEKIRINDQGRVDHWPEGFMDEDIKEFQQLIDAMYGCEDDEDENFSNWDEK